MKGVDRSRRRRFVRAAIVASGAIVLVNASAEMEASGEGSLAPLVFVLEVEGRYAAEGTTMDRILEALFTEEFGAEALEAERAALPDPPAFYESLRAKLLAAQPVSGEDLKALARARAESIALELSMEAGDE